MPSSKPPTCRTCGEKHWPFVTCDGVHRGAQAAKDAEVVRRQQVAVRETVTSPPLPPLKTDQTGFRVWGDRLENFDLLGGSTLVKRKGT